MFECRVCSLRLFRAITGDRLPSLRLRQQRLPQSLPRLSHPAARRTKADVAVSRHDGTDVELQPGAQPIDTSPTSSASMRRAVQTELRYLTDPLKLAEHVHYTLRCDKPEKALELCRMASKNGEVIVSWNHCIDWHMKRGKTNTAIKIYNEMKKRGQFPDSHTHTLILRGLARKQPKSTNEERRSNVVRAISMYNSLSSPNSRVKPNIIHSNAVLTVCREAYDLDAMWGIKAKLPKSGPNAADERTYAIILNALRHAAFPDDDQSGVYVETMAQQRRQMVIQGRELWQEVVARWSAGDILPDEKLVIAMGQLLLFSKQIQDWDDVMSLIQQTMNVERQLPPIGSSGRSTEHIPIEEETRAEAGEPAGEEAVRPDPEVEGEREAYKATLSARAFNMVNPLVRSVGRDMRERARPLTHVRPDNATLSLLIQACSQLRAPKAAWSYWMLLTQLESDGGFGIKPDLLNFHLIIRLLATNRQSAKVAELLEASLPVSGVTPVGFTFRLAMEVCQRDNKNKSVLGHARRVVESMLKALPEPDVPTLEQYLSLTVAVADGKVFFDTLKFFDPIVDVLKSKFASTTDDRGNGATPKFREIAEERKQTIFLFQQLIGAFDTARQRGFVPEGDLSRWHGWRRALITFTDKHRKVLQQQQEQLREGAVQSGRRRDNHGKRNYNEGFENAKAPVKYATS